jgi:hypothetical protein
LCVKKRHPLRARLVCSELIYRAQGPISFFETYSDFPDVLPELHNKVKVPIISFGTYLNVPRALKIKCVALKKVNNYNI